MVSKSPRPPGVVIVSLIFLIFGFVYLLFATFEYYVSFTQQFYPGPGFDITPGQAASILVLLGMLAGLTGYKLVSGARGGWRAALVLSALGLVFTLPVFGSASALSWNLMVIYQPGSVILVPGPLLDLLVLWYLWRPNVRAYFGRMTA